LSFPESLYALPARYAWSPWRPWDADDAASRTAFAAGLDPIGAFPGSGRYLFAVQAMDEAGAVTPVFDWSTPGKNNVALVEVSSRLRPLLVVHEPALGTLTFHRQVRAHPHRGRRRAAARSRPGRRTASTSRCATMPAA
jgi:hypothetical protein